MHEIFWTQFFYFYWKKVIGRLLELAVHYAALDASCGIFSVGWCTSRVGLARSRCSEDGGSTAPSTSHSFSSKLIHVSSSGALSMARSGHCHTLIFVKVPSPLFHLCFLLCFSLRNTANQQIEVETEGGRQRLEGQTVICTLGFGRLLYQHNAPPVNFNPSSATACQVENYISQVTETRTMSHQFQVKEKMLHNPAIIR